MNTLEARAVRGVFRWQMGEHNYRVEGYRGGFDRVRVDIQTLRIMGHPSDVALYQVLADVPTADAVRQQLREELHQTIRLCRWNQAHLPATHSRYEVSYSQLESWVDEGHPYHPSFKARTGFSEQDHARFGPEAGEPFQLEWLAVKFSHLNMALPVCADVFWRQELGEPTWAELTQALALQGEGWDGYALMPLHPWQFTQLYGETWTARSSRDVLHLGSAGDHYVATQSLRTLRNHTHPERAHIKLPLSLVNSSSVRTLDPCSVCHAPAISQWLKLVIDSDPTLQSVVILQEYAAGLVCQADPNADPAGEGRIGMIMRESVEGQLLPGEQAVPFNALSLLEQDGRAFIAPWLSRYGVEVWLERLLEVAVVPVWHVLVAHGLALEAHGQNMVLVHEEGWPQRLMLRDFHESLEFYTPFLADAALKPDGIDGLTAAPSDANPGYYGIDSVEGLRELVMDTLFVYNLTELALLLETEAGLPETHFWQCVADTLTHYALEHPTLTDRLAMLGYAQPTIQTESLITRKLRQSPSECHHTIRNPLAHPQTA
ncbi:IucA/IucC family protein [Photobacterium aphoticum]|nr:IucA/IucC family protein [Photobacterium aphoticum]